MTALTSAITSHDHAAIADALAAEPTSASEVVGGWLPIQWAEKSGNLITFTRTARITGHPLNSSAAKDRLRQYVALVSSTEYEPFPEEQMIQMIWSSVFDGKTYKVDRWQRPLIASLEAELDIKYLMSLAGVSSQEQLKEVVKSV